MYYILLNLRGIYLNIRKKRAFHCEDKRPIRNNCMILQCIILLMGST